MAIEPGELISRASPLYQELEEWAIELQDFLEPFVYDSGGEIEPDEDRIRDWKQRWATLSKWLLHKRPQLARVTESFPCPNLCLCK